MDKLRSLIIGSILGDGCINKIDKKGKNSRISFGHCEKQLDYLKWKISILREYNLDGKLSYYKSISNRYKNGFCSTYYSKSKCNFIFNRYRELYYPNNKKTLNFEDLEISPLALAIWYMDDGHICSSSYQINTQSFSKEDLLNLVVYLKNTYNLEFTIDKNSVLYLRKQSIKKFELTISDCIIESMKYKLRGSV